MNQELKQHMKGILFIGIFSIIFAVAMNIVFYSLAYINKKKSPDIIPHVTIDRSFINKLEKDNPKDDRYQLEYISIDGSMSVNIFTDKEGLRKHKAVVDEVFKYDSLISTSTNNNVKR